MDVDGAIVDFGRVSPNGVEKLRARKHAAGSLKQKFKQAKLSRSEMDVARTPAHALICTVESDVADDQEFGHAFGPTAPQQRAHAGHQFGHRERFDDVIIDAGCESAHALGFFGAPSA